MFRELKQNFNYYNSQYFIINLKYFIAERGRKRKTTQNKKLYKSKNTVYKGCYNF